uniref:(northern house mosquito) hypothetical protein n=1 Tax=Culex pipiens TaxID=7175 RepID=A0A8D8JCC4_CULPI
MRRLVLQLTLTHVVLRVYFFTRYRVLQSGGCVLIFVLCTTMCFILICCKMNFRYLIFLSVSLKHLFVSKSTEQKMSEMLPYLLSRIFCCTFCLFSFYLKFSIRNTFCFVCRNFTHTLLLNITRSHVLLFVLFAVASNSSSSHQNEMLASLSVHSNYFRSFLLFFPRCTL